MRNGSDARIREEVNRLGIPPKEMLKREIALQDRKESYKKLICGMMAGLLVVTAVIIIITNFWVAVLQIDGSSMSPLLQMDEIVITVRGDTPVKNDIIAFTHNNNFYIKRAVAVAGDRVEINGDGVGSVNGEVLYEPYVSELSFGNCDIEFPYQVPAETVFVLGDNRSSSIDSRDSQFGTVSREQIIGRVKFRVWPLSQIGSVS